MANKKVLMAADVEQLENTVHCCPPGCLVSCGISCGVSYYA